MSPIEDDNAAGCCEIGVCCNEAKRRAALARKLMKHDPHLGAQEAAKASDYIHDNYDLLLKAWGFGKAFYERDEMARAHPYV